MLQGADQFDIESTPQKLPQKHVVAVRITSENASDGFKPTAGRVDEVGSADIPFPQSSCVAGLSMLSLLE
jgi:acetyl-CoA carboxylase/biotin carboxylase 1